MTVEQSKQRAEVEKKIQEKNSYYNQYYYIENQILRAMIAGANNMKIETDGTYLILPEVCNAFISEGYTVDVESRIVETMNDKIPFQTVTISWD